MNARAWPAGYCGAAARAASSALNQSMRANPSAKVATGRAPRTPTAASDTGTPRTAGPLAANNFFGGLALGGLALMELALGGGLVF